MNETYATGFVNPKTTALFFDKLYIPEKLVSSGYGFEHGYFLIPNEVRFFYNNELDDWYSYAYKICSSRNSCITYPEAFNLPEYSFSSANIISIRDIEEAKLSKKVKQRLKDKYNACGEFHLSVFRNEFLQLVAQEIKKNLNINLVPIFFDKTDFEQALEKEKAIRLMKKAGIKQNDEIETNVYEAVITCNQMIDEDKLTWEQVLEIRKDKLERGKLKRFRAWADSNFSDFSKDQINDTICKTYNDYVAALQKHGVKTLCGSIGTVLAETAIGALSAWGGNTVNFVGLGLQIGVGMIPLGKAVKDYVKLRREPIAYYYDIKNKW